MKRICVLVFNFQGRGVQRSQIRLASHYFNIGHEVDVVCFQNKGDFGQYIPSGINIVNLNANTAKSGLLSLIKYLWKAKPNIVFSAEDHVNTVLLLAKLCCPWRFKTSVSCRVSPKLWGVNPKVLSKYGLTKILVKLLYPFASQVVALSSEMADDYSDLFGIKRDKIKVIFNPIIGALMSSDEVIEGHHWLNDGNVKVILAAGNISWIKGFDALIKALPPVLEVHNARLVILGEGPDKEELTQLTYELGVNDFVEFSGFQVDTMKYMRAADVFVLSSLSEGCPNVLLEAICSGCSVVSTLYGNGGGAREIMENGLIGPLVPVGDVDALSKAIIATLDTPVDKAVLQKSAERFHVNVIAERYLEELV